MIDLRDLYQQLILDHNKSPRNCGELEDADGAADGYNPLCGDRIKVMVKYDNDIISDINFAGTGCAISTASASLMTESLEGKTLDEAKRLFKRFHGLIMGEPVETDEGPELGKLEVFSGVCQYPARVKCATLAWHTVNAALANVGEDVVSTE